MAALSLTSITPPVVDNDGGRAITVWGTFTRGVNYQVYLGASGSTADAPCYAGPGQGINVMSYDGQTLNVFTPQTDPTLSTYDVTVACPAQAAQATLTSAVEGRPPFLQSSTYALRGVQNPRWAFGPRTPAQEAPAT